MTSLLQVVRCHPGKAFEAHPKTEGLQRRYAVRDHEDRPGSLLLWGGGNPFKASVNVECFEDRQRNLVRRRAATNDKYDVPQTMDPVGDGCTAILCIRATPTSAATPADFYSAVQASGSGFGADSSWSFPGAMAKAFLSSREGNVVGGCFFFSDATTMEDSLASDEWKDVREQTPWENLTIEQLAVTDSAVAASA